MTNAVSPTRKRRVRLLLFIGIPLLLLAVMITVAVLGVNTFLKPTVKRALSKVVVEGSDSLYTFSLGDYTLGMGGRSVDISNLRIQIDSNRYRQMKAANTLPPLIFSVQLSKAAIRGLNPWALWRNKNISCNSIVLEGSIINVQQQKNDNDTAKKEPPKTLYEAIKPDINEIDINYIQLTNSNVIFKTLQVDTAKKEDLRFDRMAIKISDIKVDANSHKDTTRILYAGNIEAGFDSLRLKKTDGLYAINIGKTAYDFKKRSVDIEWLTLTPAVSQQEFNRRMGHEADRFTVDIKKIDIANFNASALLVQNKVETGVITLSQPDIALYKDKTAGPNNTNKMGKYPHQLLMKAPFSMDVDSIKIKNGRFTYTEKNIKTLMDGSFKFANVNGFLSNVTNQGVKIAKNGWCKADLRASFMGNNAMRAIFSFDLRADDGHFMVDANLASLEASQINTIFRPLARAELETFSLDKLDYHVEGNDHSATGNLSLLYHNLKLNVLKEEDGEFKKKGLITLLANLLKLHSSNPEEGEAERKAIGIREPRIPTKNFFGLVIKTLLTCTQEIAVKGKNKSLPGLGGKKPDEKQEDKKEDKKKDDDKKKEEKKKDEEKKKV